MLPPAGNPSDAASGGRIRQQKPRLRVLSRALERPLPLRWLIVAASAVGVLLVLDTLDVGFILGGERYWGGAWDDSAQSLAGLHAFVRDRWRFPLLSVGTYGVPEGANAANDNTIPLVSMLVKLAYPLTHSVFVFFGAWIAVCRVLHAVLGALLLRELGESRAAPVLAIALLFAGLPSLLDRIPHADLSAQFLLPAALIGYLRVVRAGPSLRRFLGAFGLMLAALLVHPYLLAMVGVLYAAALAELWRRGRLGALGVARPVAAALLGLSIPILALGYLGAVMSPFPHFGQWSLNLLSPFLLAESRLLPAARLIGETDCLRVDGVNYLGLGGIGLIVMAFVSSRRGFVAPLRRHLVLCGVLAGLLVFALSNRIRLGNALLLSYPLPSGVLRLAEVFRASERFFWPVSVALLVWSVAVLARHLPAARAALVIGLACAIQWVDLAGARERSFYRSTHPGPDALGGARRDWTTLITSHAAVEVYPSYACGENEENEFDLQLQLIAVKAGVVINSAYLSRPNKDCRREAEQEREALRTSLPPGVLRIFYRRAEQPLPEPAGGGEDCRRFDGEQAGLACTRAWSESESISRDGRWFRALPRPGS